MYHPVYSANFEKQIKKFPRKEQIKIVEKIENILEEPRKFSIKLETTKPIIYRLRVGEYRVFFSIEDQDKIVKMIKVERRTTQTYH